MIEDVEPSWSPTVLKTLGRLPRVGDWYSECCQEDLFQITEVAQLTDIQERHAEGIAIGEFFDTKAKALAALEPSHAKKR